MKPDKMNFRTASNRNITAETLLQKHCCRNIAAENIAAENIAAENRGETFFTVS